MFDFLWSLVLYNNMDIFMLHNNLILLFMIIIKKKNVVQNKIFKFSRYYHSLLSLSVSLVSLNSSSN